MISTEWTKSIYHLLLGYTPESRPGWKMQIYTKAGIRKTCDLGMCRRRAWLEDGNLRVCLTYPEAWHAINRAPGRAKPEVEGAGGAKHGCLFCYIAQVGPWSESVRMAWLEGTCRQSKILGNALYSFTKYSFTKALLHSYTVWAAKDLGVNCRVRLGASSHSRCIQLDFAQALQSNKQYPAVHNSPDSTTDG